MNSIRHGKLVIDKNLAEEGVLEEAEFYSVTALISLVKERIKQRDFAALKDTSSNPNGSRKNVYRVLQCHEDELTNLVRIMDHPHYCQKSHKVACMSLPILATQPNGPICRHP